MCSIEIANQTIHQKTCILQCMEVHDYYFHRKEYAVTTHRNVWYFYRYHPMLSNGTAGWPCPHISNCYHGELSPYLLNVPVVTLSLAVLLIFIEPEPAEDFRVFTQTCRIVNTRRFLDLLSPGNFFPRLLAHGAPSGIAIFA